MLPIDESNPRRDASWTDPPPPRSLNERVEARLRGSSYLSLARISCDHWDGVLVLRGRVPSYYLKQLASAVVAEVEGVQPIDNRIEIVGPAARRPVGSAAQPTEGGNR